MPSKRVIKGAIDNILSTHGIVDSGFEGKLSDLEIGEIRSIMVNKFRGNQDYIGRARLLEGIGDREEVRGLLDLKEDFFSEELSRLESAVRRDSQLNKFRYDNSTVRGNSYELKYNEYQRQLRNFADTELEAPNKLLRSKVLSIDPNYNFSKLDRLSWARQNEILGNELTNLQEYALDIHNLKQEVLALNPNYDESRLAGKNLYSQFRSLSGTLANLENKSVGRSTLQDRLMNMDQAGFNQLWTVQDPKLRREIRGAWGDNYVYREGDTYYRSGIDQGPQYVPPPQGPTRDLLQEQKDKFNDINSLGQTEFQEAWNKMNSYEKTLYQQHVGEVHTFRDSAGNVHSIRENNESALRSLDEQTRNEYESWLLNRDTALSLEQEQAAEAARTQRFLGDRQQLQFERTERSTEEQITGYTPVEKSPVGGKVEQSTEATNEIAAVATEEKTVGETGAARIERMSMSNILATDTAASYVFGYKQKALLGAMGTLGAISLLEANSHGGGREALERKRALEEQRRMKKYGY